MHDGGVSLEHVQMKEMVLESSYVIQSCLPSRPGRSKAIMLFHQAHSCGSANAPIPLKRTLFMLIVSALDTVKHRSSIALSYSRSS